MRGLLHLVVTNNRKRNPNEYFLKKINYFSEKSQCKCVVHELLVLCCQKQIAENADCFLLSGLICSLIILHQQQQQSNRFKCLAIAINNFIIIYSYRRIEKCVINLILARNCISQYREQFAVERAAAESTLLLRVKVNFIACYASDKRSRFFFSNFFNFDTAWCVACGRPSITALTWCRGISWSGALNIFLMTGVEIDNISIVEGKKWKKAGMFAHFFVEKLFSAFVIWNGLTDRTSCFDRKLCTDWSWLCETSRFCSTETGVCGLMIHSLLGKLLNLSSLLTTPTVVQNCRCCVLSALSSSSSSSSSCV
ncbi:hypothetical protein T01_5999 [Trichinella spiralis]|uniref:Uncharacterized protein n=1 Tax=Trichinella spiralis TaxID=6334 RepID=A0A0V1B2H4_TRISP|nr:hypothetical protein T01_14980 [Trichinella spiralis]KRY31210.1 hypothetical protein T01_5999 [Trichinella spiralis]